MDQAESINQIVTSVFSLLAIVGVPVAVFAAPITGLITGIFGLRKKKGK